MDGGTQKNCKLFPFIVVLIRDRLWPNGIFCGEELSAQHGDGKYESGGGCAGSKMVKVCGRNIDNSKGIFLIFFPFPNSFGGIPITQVTGDEEIYYADNLGEDLGVA